MPVCLKEQVHLTPVGVAKLYQRWMATCNINVLLCFGRATESASRMDILQVVWRTLGQIPRVRHPIKQVFGATASLPRCSPFNRGEQGHEGRVVSCPASGFVGIYTVHVSLLCILLEFRALSSLCQGSMIGGGPLHPLPGARRNQRRVYLLRCTVKDSEPIDPSMGASGGVPAIASAIWIPQSESVHCD